MDPGTARSTEYEHDVALSFAAEQRWYVDVVARCLRDHRISVYYDMFETSRLWGRDGIELFTDVYANKAFRVVMFISREYVEKAWPTIERRAALSRFLADPTSDAILPVRFDDALVPGLSPQRLYQRADTHTPMALAELIIAHLVDVGRCPQSILDEVGAAKGLARRVAFSSMVHSTEQGFQLKYRIHNGTDSLIDGVVVAVADPGMPDCSPDHQTDCALELVIGTVGPGETIEDTVGVQFTVEPVFVETPYMATLLWTDVDDNHWAACGTELRRRMLRARTC